MATSLASLSQIKRLLMRKCLGTEVHFVLACLNCASRPMAADGRPCCRILHESMALFA